MDNSEVYQVLASYKEAIDTILERLDELDKMVEDYHSQYDDRFHKIEDTVNNDILKPAQDAFNKFDYDRRFGEFHDKYGQQLDVFNDKFKVIPGNEDYDMAKEAFDEYNGIEGDKPDEDAYVAELVKQAGETLDAIKQAMGLDSNAVVEVEKNGDADATIEVEDKETQDKEEAAGHGDEVKEEIKEDIKNPNEDGDIEISDDAVTDPKALEALTKKYEKMMGRK